jgi:hypothetical protein
VDREWKYEIPAAHREWRRVEGGEVACAIWGVAERLESILEALEQLNLILNNRS